MLQEHGVLADDHAAHDARLGAQCGAALDHDVVQCERPEGVGVADDVREVDARAVLDDHQVRFHHRGIRTGRVEAHAAADPASHDVVKKREKRAAADEPQRVQRVAAQGLEDLPPEAVRAAVPRVQTRFAPADDEPLQTGVDDESNHDVDHVHPEVDKDQQQ